LKEIRDRYTRVQTHYVEAIQQVEQERRERQDQTQAQQRVREEALARAISEGRVNQRNPQTNEWVSVQHQPPAPVVQAPAPDPIPGPKLKLNFIEDSKALLNEEDDNTCSICLEEIDSKTICKTSCGHAYHHKCIVSVMKTMNHHKNDCPMCRKRVDYISVTKDVGFDIMTRSKQSITIHV
jgi:hypothetical protein